MRSFYKPVWSILIDPCITVDTLYRLPMMHCDACGVKGGAGGLHYPWIEVSSLFPPEKLRMLDDTKRRIHCSWEEFRYYQTILRKSVPAGYPLAPAAILGTMLGKVYKRPKDFEMPFNAALVAKRMVVSKLTSDGFSIQSSDIFFKKKVTTEDHVCLFAPPVGMAVNIGYCQECERGSINADPVIDSSTIPEGLHFFRLKNEDSVMIFSEELVKAIRAHKFTGLEFVRVACE